MMAIVVVIVAALFTPWLAAIAILLASLTTTFAAVPDRIGNYVEMPDWFARIIAVNHKLVRS
jgi:dolichol kinase